MDVIGYLKREMIAVVEEVAVEDGSGLWIDDIGDLELLEDVEGSENGFGSFMEIDIAELSEARNGTPAVDDEDWDESDEEWEFSVKSNPDDDAEYLKELAIDTEFTEGKKFFNGYKFKRHQRMLERILTCVNFMPMIAEGNEEDVTEEENDSEENRVEWLSGYDWAEECCKLWSGFDWAEECDNEND